MICILMDQLGKINYWCFVLKALWKISKAKLLHVSIKNILAFLAFLKKMYFNELEKSVAFENTNNH